MKYKKMLEKTIERLKINDYEDYIIEGCVFCEVCKEKIEENNIYSPYDECIICQEEYNFIFNLCCYHKHRNDIIFDDRKEITKILEKELENELKRIK